MTGGVVTGGLVGFPLIASPASVKVPWAGLMSVSPPPPAQIRLVENSRSVPDEQALAGSASPPMTTLPPRLAPP